MSMSKAKGKPMPTEKKKAAKPAAKKVETAPKPTGPSYDAMSPKQRREYDLQERLKGNA